MDDSRQIIRCIVWVVKALQYWISNHHSHNNRLSVLKSFTRKIRLLQHQSQEKNSHYITLQAKKCHVIAAVTNT